MERKNWGIVEEDFVVPDLKAPTPGEEQKLQLNDQALNCIYEALDPKVFESIKNLEMAHKVWKRLKDAYEGIWRSRRPSYMSSKINLPSSRC